MKENKSARRAAAKQAAKRAAAMERLQKYNKFVISAINKRLAEKYPGEAL